MKYIQPILNSEGEYLRFKFTYDDVLKIALEMETLWDSVTIEGERPAGIALGPRKFLMLHSFFNIVPGGKFDFQRKLRIKIQDALASIEGKPIYCKSKPGIELIWPPEDASRLLWKKK